MNATTTAPKKRGRPAKAATAAAAPKAKLSIKTDAQTQAPAAKAKTSPAKKSAAPKKDVQQQAPTMDVGVQGGTSAGDKPKEIRAGLKNVLIENVPMPARPGRPEKPEEYPFMALEPAKKVDKEIIGQSFFIPDSDEPAKHIAAARKRHKGVLFWIRKTMGKINGEGPEVPGQRVWRGNRDFTA